MFSFNLGVEYWPRHMSYLQYVFKGEIGYPIYILFKGVSDKGW